MRLCICDICYRDVDPSAMWTVSAEDHRRFDVCNDCYQARYSQISDPPRLSRHEVVSLIRRLQKVGTPGAHEPARAQSVGAPAARPGDYQEARRAETTVGETESNSEGGQAASQVSCRLGLDAALDGLEELRELVVDMSPPQRISTVQAGLLRMVQLHQQIREAILRFGDSKEASP